MNDVLSNLRLFEFDESVNSTIEALVAERLQEAERLGFGADVILPPELAALAADDYPDIGSKEIRDLRDALSRVHEEHPVAALLAAAATSHPSSPELFDILVARTMQLAIGLAASGDCNDDDILNVCRRAWRLMDDDFDGVIEWLPRFDQPYATIAQELKALSASSDRKLKKFRKRLVAWDRSVRTFVDARDKREVTASGISMLVPGQARDIELDEDEDVRMTVADTPIDSAHPNAMEETCHDRSKEGAGARIQDKSDPMDRSHGVVQVRGEQILHRQLMQFASPRSHRSRLTDNETLRAFRSSYDRAETSSGYLFAALSILTGRRAERLATLKLVEGKLDYELSEYFFYRNRTLALYYQPELPKFEDLMRLGILAESNDTGLAIPIPPALAKPLLKYLRRPRRPHVKRDFAEAIGQLAKSIDTRVTGPRLSKTMKHRLTSLGIDEVDTALLSGVHAEHCAGLYYSVVPRERLVRTYCDYVYWLLQGHKDQKDLNWPPLPTGVIGSRIRIPEEVVSRFFTLSANALQDARQHQSACDIYEFHNRYVLYTVQLLSLCSAIRSVTEPFGNAFDLNSDARTLRLVDKVNRDGTCDRFVPMPKIAVDQVRAYQAHLQQMYQEFRDVDLVLENTISRSLSGDDAWLFYFDRRHRTKVVRPKWILTQLRHTWPLPGNWPRHFLSTWLRDKGFGRGALRAFFGHADHGPAPLSDFDGTSMFELRRLGDEIDEMLSSLNIGAVQGWNTNS